MSEATRAQYPPVWEKFRWMQNLTNNKCHNQFGKYPFIWCLGRFSWIAIKQDCACTQIININDYSSEQRRIKDFPDGGMGTIQKVGAPKGLQYCPPDATSRGGRGRDVLRSHVWGRAEVGTWPGSSLFSEVQWIMGNGHIRSEFGVCVLDFFC